MKIVTLNYDDIPESPNDWGSWKLYSFQTRHVSYRNPNDFFPEGKPTIGFRRKLVESLAQEVAAIVRGDQVKFEGDAKYLSNYYDFVYVCEFHVNKAGKVDAVCVNFLEEDLGPFYDDDLDLEDEEV